MHVAQSPGGVERYLYTLLKYIDKSEYNNILVLSQNYDIQKFKNLATKIEIVEMYREIGFLKEIKAVFNIRKLIKKYHPDVVYIRHCQEPSRRDWTHRIRQNFSPPQNRRATQNRIHAP